MIGRPRRSAARELGAGLAHIKKLIDLRVLVPDYEAVLERHYRAWLEPGDVVFDVGAHEGRHTRHFLDLVGAEGKVVAFEPLTEQFRLLRESFASPNFAVHRVALGAENGETTFVVAAGTPQESGLRQRIYNTDATRPVEVPIVVRKLNRYTRDLARLDWVKIDIEGGEVDCLRGATDALQRLRPVVSVEYGWPGYSVYGQTADSLFDVAESHNYVLVDIFLNVLDTRELWRLGCDSVYWDYLMVPREKLGEFVGRLAP